MITLTANETYRVMLIEDDADTRGNLTDILEIDNFDVVSSGTAADALAYPEWRSVAVVLMDRKLPDGNMLELLPRINVLAPQATIIVITGYADLDGAITALRYGAADYILKPINADALRKSLARIVERLRIQRQLQESQLLLEEQRKLALQNERLAAIGETMTALIHESRNALQRSVACLEMLSLDLNDRPKSLDLVRRIQRAQDDLQKLYEEVRHYAAPINLNRSLCDLGQLWREAWQNLAPAHEQKELQLREDRADTNLAAVVDSFAMRQVMRNILENAIDVSPERGVITVRVSATSLNNQKAVSVSFRDRGPGLSDEVAKHIFKPFFTTKTKGTGLGMAISQRIVCSHQGEITVGNSDEGGAEINVVLPREIS